MNQDNVLWTKYVMKIPSDQVMTQAGELNTPEVKSKGLLLSYPDKSKLHPYIRVWRKAYF